MAHRPFYGEDLSFIHDRGFGSFSRNAAVHIIEQLRVHDIADGDVLDLGCGSGIFAEALLDAGYSVTGIDISTAMLEIARRNVPGATFIRASIHEAELPPSRVVTALGEVVSYGPDARERFGELVPRVARALRPGGFFIFDLIVRSEGAPQDYRASREGEGWRVDVEVSEDPERWRLTRRIVTTRLKGGEPLVSEEVHEVSTFDQAAVGRRLEECGFHVTVESSYGSEALAQNRLAFLAHLMADDI